MGFIWAQRQSAIGVIQYKVLNKPVDSSRPVVNPIHTGKKYE